jgi:O-antigen ligase
MWVILAVALGEVLYGFWNFHSRLIWGWKNPFGGSFLHGTFINRNHLGNYLSLALSLGLGLFLALWDRTPRLQHNLRGRPLLKAWSRPEYLESHLRLYLFFLLLVGLGVGLIFTGSRSAMISLLVGLMLMWLLNRGPQRITLWPFVLFLFVVALYSIWLGGAASFYRFLDFLDVEHEGRYQIFWGAFHLWRQFPWLGSGLGTFGDVFFQFQPVGMGLVRIDQTHNDWLQLLPEAGLIGFILLGFSWVYFYALLVRKWRNHKDRFNKLLGLGGLTALFVGAVHALGDFPFHIPALLYTYAGIAALTYLILSGPAPVDGEGRPARNFPFRRLLPAALSAGLIAVQVVYMHTVWNFWRAEGFAPTEMDSTRLPRRVESDDFRRAISLNSRNSRYYLGLAQALTTRGQSGGKADPEAEGLWAAAVYQAPASWYYRYKLAEFYLEHYRLDSKGYLSKALKELTAAIELYPQSGFLNLRLGTTLDWMEKNFSEPIPREFQGQSNHYFEKALQLDPKLKKHIPTKKE